MAYVLAPDGTPGEVPDAQLEAAVQAGYKPRAPAPSEVAKKQAADEPFQAGAEGVARGASFGLSDPILKGIGVRGIAARKEANPIASGAGEVAGAVGTSLATGGGASALVGGGIKGAAFEGGLYGLGSMVSESSLDNTPLTTERMAAGFMSGAVVSGLTHGALTAVGKGASLGMSKFGGGALKQTLTNAADDMTYSALTKNMSQAELARMTPYKADFLQAAKAAGVTAIDQSNVAKVEAAREALGKQVGEQFKTLESHVPLSGSPELRNEVADAVEARLAKFKDSPAYDDALKEVQKYITSIREKNRTWGGLWEDIQSTLFKDADPTKSAVGEVREEVRQSIRDFVFNDVASGKNKAGKVLTASWAPEGVKMGRGSKGVPLSEAVNVPLGESSSAGVFDLASRVEGNLPDMPNPEALGVYKHPLDQSVNNPSMTVRLGEPDTVSAGKFYGDVVSKDVRLAAPEAGFQLGGARQLSGPEIEAAAQGWQGQSPRTVTLGEDLATPSKVGGLAFDKPAVASPEWLGAQMRQTGRDFRSMSAVHKALSKRAHALDKGGSLSDTMLLGLVTGNPIGAAAAGLAKEQIERRGALMSASVLRALADSKAGAAISKGLSEHLGNILSIAPEALGAYRYPLAVAAAQGADALLATHLSLASGPHGADYLAKAALPVESQQEVEATGHRVAVLDAMHALAEQQAVEMDKAADGILGTSPGRKGGTISSTLSVKDFTAMKAQFERLQANPEAAFEGVPANVRGAAPMTSMQTAAKAAQAMQYLASKAPKNPYEGMPVSIAPEWKPSAAELDKFNRYREAVVTPAQVLKNMSKGYISPEQVEALQAVYPSIYADLQQKLGEKVMMLQKPLTHAQKLALAPILGPNVLNTSPQQRQVLQQTQTLASGQNSGQGKPGGGGSDGRQKVDQEKSLETQSQRLEAR